MRNVFLIVIACLIAFSCQSPIDKPSELIDENPQVILEPEPVQEFDLVPISVLNSRWMVVKQDFLKVPKSRSIETTDAIQKELDEYNSNSTDDQWFMVQGEVPPIEESPDADMWMVDPVTYDVVDYALDIPRETVRENWEEWRRGVALQGLVLFVDKVPPAPIPDPNPPTPYELYAIYVFDADGNLQYETHCEDWAERGAHSIDFWFYQLSTAWESQIQIDGLGWTMIKGRLWTPS